MSIAINSSTLPDHVLFVCTGAFSVDGMRALFDRVFASAANAEREAALVDVRGMTGEPTMAERYELAVRVADLQASRQPRVRLAVVGHEPLIHPERFGEIIATNRGAVARAFTDEAVALDWLLGRR